MAAQPAVLPLQRPGATDAACALLIGAPSAEGRLVALLSKSPWIIAKEPNLAAAIRTLAREAFTAVFCDSAAAKQTAAALRAFAAPPMLIVLSTETRSADGIDSIGPEVFCVNIARSPGRELLSLLNLARRMRNETIDSSAARNCFQRNVSSAVTPIAITPNANHAT